MQDVVVVLVAVCQHSTTYPFYDELDEVLGGLGCPLVFGSLKRILKPSVIKASTQRNKSLCILHTVNNPPDFSTVKVIFELDC